MDGRTGEQWVTEWGDEKSWADARAETPELALREEALRPRGEALTPPSARSHFTSGHSGIKPSWPLV